MEMNNILITGGCGFVGSSLAIKFKTNYPKTNIICLDNLKRRGSELNISRLKEGGIEFFHGDIRNKEDLKAVGQVDIIIECSAEPSVLAGYNSSPEYLINTNLLGTINCLEKARKEQAAFIFLSTSRVYPIKTINKLSYVEKETRFELGDNQSIPGVSENGFGEMLSLLGPRSLYGATKLASELIIQEYIDMYGVKSVINRCGLLTGPWQFGKVDQGVVVLWVARHYWKQKLSYIGFGGEGKQVRDMLHIDDLYRLLAIQIKNLSEYNGEIFNVGGGLEVSLSLRELTALCEEITGNRIEISKEKENRQADIPFYVTDNSKISKMSGWAPRIKPQDIVKDIYSWIVTNENILKGVLK